MKGKELKNNDKKIELLDGTHKITVDFNTFEKLEEIYGDMQTAFSKFNANVKFTDIKNFLCAGINSAEDSGYTPHQIGKLLEVSKLTDYVTVLGELLTNAMPQAKETDEDTEENEEGKN